jgi:putative OPT family oligopeptide transporter
LIVERKELIYPEGVACSLVLKAGEKRGTDVFYVFSALGLGAVFKFFVSGISVIKSVVEYAFRIRRTAIYIGADVSPALIGVGYIVGFNVALLVFIGGAIGWIVGIPLYGLIYEIPYHSSLIDAFYKIWSTQIRYIGVGAMIVGGIWSIINVRHSIIKGFKGIVLKVGKPLERTTQDLSGKQVIYLLFSVAIPIFVLYSILTQSFRIGIVAGFSMLLASLFFVAVSSYIVGLVGSSNNPVSGMTIITVLFASVILLLFRLTGTQGILATLGVAGVVCCAACTAGDISQDLKTGYLVRATPKFQQIAQIIGVLVSAFIIAPILIVLHNAYGIGTGEPEALSAPQASLFASLTTAIFTGKPLPWTMIIIGIGIGIGLICIDQILIRKKSSFRAYVMPTAVGIYLPLGLSFPIAIGGLISLIVRKSVKNEEPALHRGVLFSSGLIAGEAIMGIIIAFLIVGQERLGIYRFPVSVIKSNPISILGITVLIFMLILFSIKSIRKEE